MPKRKRIVKPRSDKRRARATVRVVPIRLGGWKILYQEEKIATATRKVDAVDLGRLLANLSACETSTSLYIHKRKVTGKQEIEEERTYTRKDDPTESPG